MKIAHVMRRLSFDDWGGTEQVVWNLAKAQKAAGHDVRIFATTALCATPHEIVEGLEIFRYRPIYPWWPMPKHIVAELDRKGGNPFVPGLGKALREWRPDVIHCHAMARIAELCLRTAQSLNTNSPTHQPTNPPTHQLTNQPLFSSPSPFPLPTLGLSRGTTAHTSRRPATGHPSTISSDWPPPT